MAFHRRSITAAESGTTPAPARRLFGGVLVLSLAIVLAFLLLPIVAIFPRIPPGELFAQLGSDAAVDALVVTLKTNVVAQASSSSSARPAAYLLATRRFRGRPLVITLIELPLVLPPAVAGIGLLAAFGRCGLLGGTLEAFGICWLHAGGRRARCHLRREPLLHPPGDRGVRVGRPGSASPPPGRSAPARRARFAGSPCRWPRAGSAPAAALAFARGIGEFGATIFFAGSLQGVTQTLPLAIYAQFDVDFDVALAIGALLVILSGAVLLTVKFTPSWTRSGLTSESPSASFRLELALEVGRETVALVGPPAPARRPCCARSPASPSGPRADRARRATRLRRRRRDRPAAREPRASASSSRSTRSFRT